MGTPSSSRFRASVLGLLLGACLAGQGAAAQAYVYWTDYGNANTGNGTTLGRAGNDGGSPTGSFITGAGAPGGIAIDGAHLYWGNQNTASIGRSNLDGSGANPTFIPQATFGSGTALPGDVAVDGTYVYWTDRTRYIGRATLDGLGVQKHFIDAGSGSYPVGIAVSGATIYLTKSDGIYSVAAAGGSPALVVAMPGGAIPTDVIVGGGYLYWTALNLGDPAPYGSVGRALTNGTDVKQKLIPGLTFPTGLATDGTRVYWADNGTSTIGRALLGSSGATDVQPSFISDPGQPFGVAVNSLVDPTQTSVQCSPSSVNQGSATTCTATVTDSASASPPTGTVVFSGDGSTFFSGASSSCTLTAQPSGGASCVTGAVSLNAGTIPVHAAYGGDAVHSPSGGATTFCSGCGGAGGGGGTSGGGGTTTTSAGNSTPLIVRPASVHCLVPKLKGKTLGQARTLLSRGHCKLGKVSRPRARRGHKITHLVVRSQKRAAGASLPADTKVALTLAKRKAKRHG